MIMKIWKNGTVVVSGTKTNVNWNTNVKRFRIGLNEHNHAELNMENKSLEDFRIYDRALSATEIEKLYLEGSDRGLITHYKFDGDFNDSVGSNHLTDEAGFTSLEFNVDGVTGQSAYVPADTATLIQTNNTNFSSMTECSISLWVKFVGDRDTESDIVFHSKDTIFGQRNVVFTRSYDTKGDAGSGNTSAIVMLLCSYDWNVGSGFVTENEWIHYTITATVSYTHLTLPTKA